MRDGGNESGFQVCWAMDRVDVAFDPSPAPERIGLGLSSGKVALAPRSSPTVASAKSRSASAGRDFVGVPVVGIEMDGVLMSVLRAGERGTTTLCCFYRCRP
jgi:hypothetical protein